MERVSSWKPSFSVRRNRPILGVWASGRTDARTHGQILENAFSESLFCELNSKKNGVGKDSRALRLARTESLPAVLYVSVTRNLTPSPHLCGKVYAPTDRTPPPGGTRHRAQKQRPKTFSQKTQFAKS